jgi:hypothetical protein
MSKREFLAVKDYGTGGIWVLITARTEDEITTAFPLLTVVQQPPAWWDKKAEEDIRSKMAFDIDDPPEWTADLRVD